MFEDKVAKRTWVHVQERAAAERKAPAGTDTLQRLHAAEADRRARQAARDAEVCSMLKG